VIQHAHLIKLNQALQVKEKKKDDRTKLFTGGFGRHMTDAEFIQSLKKHEEEKREEEAERRGRVADREAKKAAKEAAEAEWKAIVAEHERAVGAWKDECARLRAEGVRVKNLPAKPRRPPKPQAALGQADTSQHNDGEADVEPDESSESDVAP
jgi:hypothetical protein